MKNEEIRKLGTERRNAAAKDLDKKSAKQIAALINREDARVTKAVRKALPQIAKAIDAIAAAIGSGGRLIYIGAGTSGRIAALDASECPPTFNVSRDKVQYVIAGGDQALSAAAEYNEDSRAQGATDIAAREPQANDVVVGIAASGRTPYTVAALEYAAQRGATTVAVVCNRRSELGKIAKIEIVTEVGPEVVSGSTRMKAGTAQKMVLNMLTTGAFARLGYVYGNLMANVHLKNEKLVERGIAVLMEATGVDRKSAEGALAAADNDMAVALVMLKAKVNATDARSRLQRANHHIRNATKGR